MLMPFLLYFTTWNGAWIARQIGTRIGAEVLAHDGLKLGFKHGFLLVGGLDLRLELGFLDGLEFGL